jgi:hypothetical protein
MIIKFFTSKYCKKSPLNTLLLNPNAVNKIINGAIATAIHIIHILIINTIATAINGIAIANICHSDNATFNRAENIHASVGMTQIELTNDEYNAVKTQTYEFQSKTSCNLLVFHSHVYLLYLSSPYSDSQ